MSALKKIISGGRTPSPQPQQPTDDHSKTTTSPTNKKSPLFRIPRQTHTHRDETCPSSDQHQHTAKQKHPIKFGKTVSPQTEVAHLIQKLHNLGNEIPSKRRYSTPYAPEIFRLAQLPIASDAHLQTLLENSLRHVTIKRAAAARDSMVTALNNFRELSVLSGVVDEYLPYALTCWDIAKHLKKKGNNVSKGVIWYSGLREPETSSTPYEGGFGLEATFVLTLSALCKIRNVIETAANFGMQTDHVLISQIKSLQVAAGMFDYAHDEVTPKAMADFVGNPPPELVPEVSSMFSSLSLCLAQALHVRRAVLNGMSAATLAKLSAAAKQLASEVLTKHDKATRLGVVLTSDIKTLANDVMSLTTGWTLQYLGAKTQANEDSGAKITSLREAIAILKTTCHSRILGKVAALDLQDLDKQLEDAVNENRVVFQHVIPDAEDLRLPQGRSLVSATVYEATRIPMANTAPTK